MSDESESTDETPDGAELGPMWNVFSKVFIGYVIYYIGAVLGVFPTFPGMMAVFAVVIVIYLGVPLFLKMRQ